MYLSIHMDPSQTYLDIHNIQFENIFLYLDKFWINLYLKLIKTQVPYHEMNNNAGVLF